MVSSGPPHVALLVMRKPTASRIQVADWIALLDRIQHYRQAVITKSDQFQCGRC